MVPPGERQRASVAVMDWDSVFALGLAVVLDRAGMHVEQPRNLSAWAQESGTRAAVVAMDYADSRYARRAARTACDNMVPLIAIVARATRESVLRALNAGACTALARDHETDLYVSAVRYALAGYGLMPATITDLPLHGAQSAPPRSLSDPDARLLALLASGVDVAAIALRMGCSTRTAYRRLNTLYERIGVSRRSQAERLAVGWGLGTAPSNL